MLASDTTGQMVRELTATIDSGQTVSDAVDVSGCTAIGFAMPAVFTGTSVTFQGAMDRSDTFVTVYDAVGVIVSYVIATSGGFPLDAKTFAPYDKIKVVSSGAEGAERLITIKPMNM